MVPYAQIKKFGLLAFGLAVIYMLTAFLLAAAVHSHFKDFVTNNLAWDTKTANLLAWIGMLLFTGGGVVAAARILLFGSKNPALYLSAVLPILIPWGLDLYFGKPIINGTNVLCCNKRPKRELYCRVIEKNATCGFDPITQDQMRPSTKKERLLWDARQRGTSTRIIMPLPSPIQEPCSIKFFFDETGPIIWYFERNDQIDLFDEEDVHPTYGVRLNPITQDVVAKLQQKCEKTVRSYPPSPPPQIETASTPSPLLSVPAYAKYINQSTIEAQGEVIPIVTRGNLELEKAIVNGMPNRLRLGVFKPNFIADGLFDRALNGDPEAIANLGLPETIRQIVLVTSDNPKRIQVSNPKGAQKITQTVRIVVIQAGTGATIDSSLIVGEGVGFTEQYAQEALREDLANKFASIKRFL
jgi:hypothetical protein